MTIRRAFGELGLGGPGKHASQTEVLDQKGKAYVLGSAALAQSLNNEPVELP